MAWFISIPTGIIINLVSPHILPYLKSRSTSINERKKQLLLSRYQDVKGHQFSKRMDEHGIVFGIVSVAVFIFGQMHESFRNAFGDYFNIFSGFVYTFFGLFSLALNVILIREFLQLKDYVMFDKYRARVIKQLVKLGGNPEALNIIDKHFEQVK